MHVRLVSYTVQQSGIVDGGATAIRLGPCKLEARHMLNLEGRKRRQNCKSNRRAPKRAEGQRMGGEPLVL